MKVRHGLLRQKLARIRLIARMRIAWEDVRERAAVDSRSTARARARLEALNRAVALLALQK